MFSLWFCGDIRKCCLSFLHTIFLLKHYLVFQLVIRRIHAYTSVISLGFSKYLCSWILILLKVNVHLNFNHKFIWAYTYIHKYMQMYISYTHTNKLVTSLTIVVWYSIKLLKYKEMLKYYFIYTYILNFTNTICSVSILTICMCFHD